MYLIDIINKILNIYSMVHKIKLNEEKKKTCSLRTDANVRAIENHKLFKQLEFKHQDTS